MGISQKKIDLLNGLNDELRKTNKFLNYNPLNDTIIINDTISFPFEKVMNGNYGNNIKEISRKIDMVTSNIFYGWENIKNGRVPKECKFETIMPTLYSVPEIEETEVLFARLITNNTNKKDNLYRPQILSNKQYGNLGTMFIYKIGETPFPITERQFDLLRENMDFDKFMDKIIVNSRTNFMKEIQTVPKEYRLVNNCYLWNLKNMSSRSVIFGAEMFHKHLIEMTGFYADRIYLYPINENRIALFHGLIEGNDMLNQINVLRENNDSINLEVFEINQKFTTTIEFTYIPMSHESKA